MPGLGETCLQGKAVRVGVLQIQRGAEIGGGLHHAVRTREDLMPGRVRERISKLLKQLELLLLYPPE